MTQLYEGMFLLDNQAVRADWGGAKAAVTELLAKHGATVRTARRWDERRLAYPIKGRKRATYLLSYFEQDGAGGDVLRHDLDIAEGVLRYLILTAEVIPQGELEKSQAELEAGFSVPPPPADDEPLAGAEEASAEDEGQTEDDESGQEVTEDEGGDASDGEEGGEGQAQEKED